MGRSPDVEDEGGVRRGEWCREAKFLVPRAGPDVLLAVVATCGGEPHILGLQLLPTIGHLVASCLLSWVPGTEKIPLGEAANHGWAWGRCRPEGRLGLQLPAFHYRGWLFLHRAIAGLLVPEPELLGA